MRKGGEPTGRVAWLQGQSIEEEVEEDGVTAGGPVRASDQHIAHITFHHYLTLTLGQCVPCPRSRVRRRERHTRCVAGSPRPLQCLYYTTLSELFGRRLVYIHTVDLSQRLQARVPGVQMRIVSG